MLEHKSTNKLTSTNLMIFPISQRDQLCHPSQDNDNSSYTYLENDDSLRFIMILICASLFPYCCFVACTGVPLECCCFVWLARFKKTCFWTLNDISGGCMLAVANIIVSSSWCALSLFQFQWYTCRLWRKARRIFPVILSCPCRLILRMMSFWCSFIGRIWVDISTGRWNHN